MRDDQKMIQLTTPVSDNTIESLCVGDTIEISGYILCGRDAVLPRLVEMIENGKTDNIGVRLQGSVIFHTAVSPAGVGPTSSNKLEIESSIAPLSKAGVKIHLGKGKISHDTVMALDRYHSVYAVIPPVTALLGSKTSETKVVAFPELGMEALHLIKVDRYPAIVGAIHGSSLYD